MFIIIFYVLIVLKFVCDLQSKKFYFVIIIIILGIGLVDRYHFHVILLDYLGILNVELFIYAIAQCYNFNEYRNQVST